MQLNVYSTYVDIPYVAVIGYTNGIANEVDNILDQCCGDCYRRGESMLIFYPYIEVGYSGWKQVLLSKVTKKISNSYEDQYEIVAGLYSL
jgi:hypothetical protein